MKKRKRPTPRNRSRQGPPITPSQQAAAAQSAPEHPLAPPRFSRILPEDLRHTGRLLVLLAEAQELGLIGTDDRARLTFVATAELVRVRGSRNPCGLFARLVRKQLWHFLTQDYLDAAQQRLKPYGQAAHRETSQQRT